MEALREVLEFRSPRRLEAADFLARINRAVPPGIRFSRLEAVPAGAPSLANATEGLVYSVDRADPDLGRRPGAKELRAALEAFKEASGAGDKIGYRLAGRRLVLLLPPVPARGIRAQDIAGAVFGAEHPEFLVRRDEVRLRN
jgi:hypothetical protein